MVRVNALVYRAITNVDVCCYVLCYFTSILWECEDGQLIISKAQFSAA